MCGSVLTWQRDVHKDVLALLLAKGADPADANGYGSSCLHLAARAPQHAAACVAQLLAHGGAASVHASNHRGSSPLHFAVFARPEAEAVATVRTSGSARSHSQGSPLPAWLSACPTTIHF